MKIALASDHGGYELKERVKQYLIEKGFKPENILDLGCRDEGSVDYPLYGKACGEAVASGQAGKGIVFCGTGIGISIAANKVKGIRCSLCTTTFMAEMTRKHNDANILALGGRILDEETALAIVDTWLNTEFEGGRHQRRVDLLDQM
jgi:ribose 5-phosphate isomerase B